MGSRFRMYFNFWHLATEQQPGKCDVIFELDNVQYVYTIVGPYRGLLFGDYSIAIFKRTMHSNWPEWCYSYPKTLFEGPEDEALAFWFWLLEAFLTCKVNSFYDMLTDRDKAIDAYYYAERLFVKNTKR